MKKTILFLAILIPIITFSQTKKEVQKIIKEVESYLQKIDYHYDDVYVDFHQKKKKITNPINGLEEEIKSLKSDFLEEEVFYNAFQTLINLSKTDCNSCTFTILDSLSQRNILFGIKENFFNKIKKLDQQNSTLKLVSENIIDNDICTW